MIIIIIALIDDNEGVYETTTAKSSINRIKIE